MKKKQVFISYKSEEFDEALWVKNTLEAQGITCWMAPMCITGGASYAAEIPAAIQNCTVFVLVLSEKVQQSKWVPRELDQAINANKTIMPFMLEDCPLNDEFAFYLSNIQRYCAWQDKQASMDTMSREIRSILGIPDPPEPEPETKEPVQPEVPVKKEPVPVTKAPGRAAAKKEKKRKKRVLPIVLSAVGAAILLPVLLAIIFNACSKVSLGNTVFHKDDHSITVENQTITPQDMQMLSKFDDLYWISLTNCTFQTEDLSAFSIPALWKLELDGCGLTDSQLQSIDFDAMENLNTLNLSNNKELTSLRSIAPVADTLTHLSIDNTGIQDLLNIKTFTNLTSLSVRNLGLKTLEPIRMAVYLDTLYADGNQLTDLKGLENTTILKTVSLKDNKLTQVDCLSNSAATLQQIYLDGNQLEDLSCLANCTAVTDCSMDRNQLHSLTWMRHWTSLVRLSAADNQISTIPFPPKTRLSFLDLSGNQIISFSDFFFADSYVTVDLSDNQCSNIKLPQGTKFKLLSLHGNALRSLSCLDGISGLTVTIDHMTDMDAPKVKAIEFSDIYIIDCPPNRIVELEQATSKVKLLNRKDIATEIPDPEFPEY